MAGRAVTGGGTEEKLTGMGEVAERWRSDLQGWGIEESILAQAPRSPWGFPRWLFDRDPDATATPSRRRALEALPEGGSVLDVGAGAGRASLALVPPAGRIVAVDESEELLTAFAGRAFAAGVDHEEIHGTWPAVYDAAPAADVVVCHHVFYNVQDLPPFARALDVKARRRVVVEMSEAHPMALLNPLWKRFWGVGRPHGPTARDALAVLAELGIRASLETWSRPSMWEDVPFERTVEYVRTRLCLPPERDAEVADAIDRGALLAPRRVSTIWWEPVLGARRVT